MSLRRLVAAAAIQAAVSPWWRSSAVMSVSASTPAEEPPEARPAAAGTRGSLPNLQRAIQIRLLLGVQFLPRNTRCRSSRAFWKSMASLAC